MEITEDQKQSIATLARKHGLSLVVLFGSQATGKTHKESDVDIGVIAGEHFDYREAYAVEGELAPILKRRDAEVVNLRRVSPLLLMRAVQKGKVLHEEHPGTLVRLKVAALRRYVETAPLRRMEAPRLEHFLKKHGR